MGGRGGSSGLTNTTRMARTPIQAPPTQPQPPQPQPPQPPQQKQQTGPVQNQIPDDNNTPVNPSPLDSLQNMNDAQLAQLYRDSQKAIMPNHLNDVDDKTQKFVFAIGMNDKPTVVDAQGFATFMVNNNIPKSQILSRSINGGQLKTSAGNSSKLTAKDVADMFKYGRLNYIGGKIGGQAYGAGTYFDMNGGGSTGYGGGALIMGVLNPNTARVISDSKLGRLARAYDLSHPQFARATGGYDTSFHNNNMSIYATVLGYNVIKSSGGYHNVIDRSALVVLK